jgi:tetratricopeptide (TPR) repeat protein
LRAALAAYPKYAEAWFWLGWLHEQRRRYQESRAAYEKAVALDGNHARPYVGLAQIAGLEQRWQEAADFSERALALEPLHFPEAYFLNALAYYKMNDLETAERSARKGQLMDAGHRIPKIHLLLADILFQKNDLTGSLQAMQQYLDLAPDAPDAEAVRALLHRRAMHP